MRVELAGIDQVGQAIDLSEVGVAADRIAAAIRDPNEPAITAAPPGPIHDHVGVIRSGMVLEVGPAVAAAGRSIGLESPQDEAIARLDREIEAIDPAYPDLRAARRRVAEAGADQASLEAAVERTSGRLNARREADLPTADLEERLRDLTRQLTEAETEAIAAREALATAERRAESARDARAERLSLVDRRENRRREARQWFLDVLGERFERALCALPVDVEPAPPRDFDGSNRDAALAIARIADPATPLVVVEAPFQTAVQARASLGAPVLLTSV